MESGLRLSGASSTVPVRNKFVKAQFSPTKDTEFVVLYENCLSLCEIFPSYEVDASTEEVHQNIRIEKKNLNAVNSTFTTFIWDELNNIYLADGFNVKYLNGTDLTEILSRDCDYQPEFFVLTQKHLIIVLLNGQFEWIYKYDPANINEEDVKPFKLEKTFFYNDEKIVSILYN